MLAYFGEAAPDACGNCDTCLAPPSVWDGTVAAQKLLSTLVRLGRLNGPSFGAGQPIDILLGKKTPRVLSYRHDTLPVFGVGGELSEGEWRGVVRQLLAAGLLAVNGEHGTLALTDLSREVLRGERQVLFRRDAAPPGPGGQKRDGARRPTLGAPLAFGVRPGVRRQARRPSCRPRRSRCSSELRAWRAAVAKEQGMPAYVIFHDATLRQIAASSPSTLAALSAVNGVGETKLARYGQQILDVLAGASP